VARARPVSVPRPVSVHRLGDGATRDTAAQAGAHALTGRGTWRGFDNRGPLQILSQGDPVLFDPCGVIRVTPARHPHVKTEAGQKPIDWRLSPAGQQAIAECRIGGEPLFLTAAG